MKPRVELVHAAGCPHVEAAREVLGQALRAAGLEPSWEEWEASSPEAPARARGFGSPTILVDGRDVAGEEPVDGPGCRIYRGESGALTGVPPRELVRAALAEARDGEASGRGRGSGWLLAPGIGVALLPKVACPACWPLYAGALSALGLGFLLDAAYLLPLTAGLLLVALGVLLRRGRARRDLGPLALALAGAPLLIAAKFWLERDPLTYGGLALLVLACAWDLRLGVPAGSSPCDSCRSLPNEAEEVPP